MTGTAVLIGSRAAALSMDLRRRLGDWDLVAPSSASAAAWAALPCVREAAPAGPGKMRLFLGVGGRRVPAEVSVARTPGRDSDAFLCQRAEDEGWPEVEVVPGLRARAAPLPVLLALKWSHIHLPVHWEKNIADFHAMLAEGPPLSASDLDLMDMRRAEAEARLVRPPSRSMAVSNSEFFRRSEERVGRVVPHDLLHEIVAYGERPMFESMKDKAELAVLSQARFEASPMRDRLRLAREESMVIGIERLAIPRARGGGWPANIAAFEAECHAYGLKRVSTTLSRGWFREFCLLHWLELREHDRPFLREFAASPLLPEGTVPPLAVAPPPPPAP